MQNLAKSKSGQCLSIIYINEKAKLKWQCKEGHIWEAPASNVKHNRHWCPHCSHNARLTIDDARKIAEKRSGKCLSENYKNVFTKMKWECSKGHIWEAKLADIKNDNTWCPECSTHKSERICRKFFETMFNAKFPRIRPDWLKSPLKKSSRFNLELDGYNEKLKLAFEFQGHQHYIHSKRWHKTRTLQMQRDRDEEKRNLCQSNGVTLIEIPWKIKLESAGKYIEEQCTTNGIKPLNSAESIDYRNFDVYKDFPLPKTDKERYLERKLKNPEKFKKLKRESDQKYLAKHSEKLKAYHKRKYWERKGQPPVSKEQKNEEYLNQLKKIAESRGGLYISTNYISQKTKMKWQCKEGHIWFAAPHHVKEGHWCPKCARIRI